jgi:hypothetical protein
MHENEWGGDGSYGDLPEMGAPNILRLLENRLCLPFAIWKTPCGPHPSLPRHILESEYRLTMSGKSVAEAARRHQEDLIVFADVNCSEPDGAIYDRYVTHRGLGALLGGKLVNKVATGDVWDHGWWGEPVSD